MENNYEGQEVRYVRANMHACISLNRYYVVRKEFIYGRPDLIGLLSHHSISMDIVPKPRKISRQRELKTSCKLKRIFITLGDISIVKIEVMKEKERERDNPFSTYLPVANNRKQIHVRSFVHLRSRDSSQIVFK